MHWKPEEKKRALRLLAYQFILWALVDIFLIHEWITGLIPSSVILSYIVGIIGEFFFTAISIYTDIRFARYLNRNKDSLGR